MPRSSSGGALNHETVNSWRTSVVLEQHAVAGNEAQMLVLAHGDPLRLLPAPPRQRRRHAALPGPGAPPPPPLQTHSRLERRTEAENRLHGALLAC